MSRIYAQSRFLGIAKTVHLLRLVSSSNTLSNRNGRFHLAKFFERRLLGVLVLVPHLKVQDWKLLNDDGIMKLQRSWRVKSFTKGLEFFQLVADIAEAEGHHPDLHLFGWNNVKIEIWTHSVGGLTENDFILAAKINSLKLEHLLTKKTASHAV